MSRLAEDLVSLWEGARKAARMFREADELVDDLLPPAASPDAAPVQDESRRLLREPGEEP